MTDDYGMDSIRGLRRGVKLELVLGPILLLGPPLVSAALFSQGLTGGDMRPAGVAILLLGGNVAFAFLMMAHAARFLQGTRGA